MRFNNYLQENMNENFIIDTIKKVKNKSSDSVLKLFKTGFIKFVKALEGEEYSNIVPQILKIINSKLGTNLKSLKDLSKLSKSKPQMSESEEMLSEDWKHYWEVIKSEAFPSLSFYPALSIWFEIDKLVKNIPGNEANFKVIAAYSVLWLLLISGKFVKEFRKWKKENPEEYHAERPGKKTKKTKKTTGWGY